MSSRSSRVGFKDYKLIVEGVKEWQNISVGTLQGWEREDRSGPRGWAGLNSDGRYM